MFLRAITCDEPRRWIEILPLAELWHNTTYNASIGMSPFLTLYGCEAPGLPSFGGITSPIEAVSSDLQRRANIVALVNDKMKRSQLYMKEVVDKKRTELVLTVGDWVMVRLQPYRQLSLAYRLHHKLAAKYFGPV